jgi:hypothetical protein
MIMWGSKNPTELFMQGRGWIPWNYTVLTQYILDTFWRHDVINSPILHKKEWLISLIVWQILLLYP